MARIVTSGFELRASGGALTDPDGQVNNTTGFNETGIVRSGSASAKCASSLSQAVSWTFAVASGNDCFVRAYVYVPTGGLPGNHSGIISVPVGPVQFNIVLETNGTLTLWAPVGGVDTQQGSASAALPLDAWNLVELRARVGVGSVDQIEGRLGGISFASASGLNVTDTTITQVSLGWPGAVGPIPAAGAIVYFDDVAVNDSSGASQTSWAGDEKIVLLRPTADSAVGTGWTLGNTTATGGNAFSRLNKAPPDSAADLTTAADADQIRNATSNANSNYDATMTTYTAAGVVAADTVNVVVPIVATGAPLVTSAKAGTVGVVSNPAITNVSLGAGGTSGAFWSGVAMGTYPTGNKWSFGTTTYAPSVTVGTAPVMRITQVTSSTRIAIVTEMGMYVSYTPAPLPIPQVIVNMAPQRA